MQLIKLTKTDLGIIVRYKTFFSVKERTIIKQETTNWWKWADNGNFTPFEYDTIFNKFYKSDLKEYII